MELINFDDETVSRIKDTAKEQIIREYRTRAIGEPAIYLVSLPDGDLFRCAYSSRQIYRITDICWQILERLRELAADDEASEEIRYIRFDLENDPIIKADTHGMILQIRTGAVLSEGKIDELGDVLLKVTGATGERMKTLGVVLMDMAVTEVYDRISDHMNDETILTDCLFYLICTAMEINSTFITA